VRRASRERQHKIDTVTDGRLQGNRPALSGFTIILVATAISGVASYVVTWLVPREIGLAGYAIFAVFWSAIYLVVGALSGIQQEITRGTHPTHATAATVSRARNFAAIAGATVFAVVVASAPLWAERVFPSEGWLLVWPLAIGTASYVAVAVLGGSLYGIARWKPLALLMILDALLRLAAISLILVFTTEVAWLAWAVAVPFPLALVIAWPFIRRSIIGRSQLDVGYRALTWNVARTIAAAASTGVMVSGFPLLLGLTSRGENSAVLGLYILTITLARAPLIVVAMSLQNYFIVTFRDNRETFWPQFLRLEGFVLGGGVLLALVGWLLGPAVFHLLFPGSLQPQGWFIAVLILSSALVGSLCISGPAVLARSRHLIFTTGWAAAAIVTIVALVLPLDFTGRTVSALISGPLAGLLVHGIYLARLARRPNIPSENVEPSALL
jgi:O-antigen/teichoic acid export membrane protein